MIELQRARINTAGAYICINGLYIFAIGIHPHNGHIPIVRLGGHREENETGWQCAVREVYEEANLEIKPLSPPMTYVYDCDDLERELQEVQWQCKFEEGPIPILVGIYFRETKTSLSVMYLAQTDGVPTPSTEVKGLLLLEDQEVHRLCQEPITIERYLRGGGKAILDAEFDMKLVLNRLLSFVCFHGC